MDDYDKFIKLELEKIRRIYTEIDQIPTRCISVVRVGNSFFSLLNVLVHDSLLLLKVI